MFPKLVLTFWGSNFTSAYKRQMSCEATRTVSEAVLLLCWKSPAREISWCLYCGHNHSHASDVGLFIYLCTYLFIYVLIYVFMYLFIRLFIHLFVCLFSSAQLSNSNSIPDRSKAFACFLSRASKLVTWKHQTYVQWLSEAIKQPEREAYYSHLISTLGMNGAISTLPLTPLWHIFLNCKKNYNKFSLWLYCWRCRIHL